jgi:hypothetical protein
LAFGHAMTGVLVSKPSLYAMIGDINGKKPDGERISYFGFTPFKTFRISDEYRRLYPAGRLHVCMRGSFVVGMITARSASLSGRESHVNNIAVSFHPPDSATSVPTSDQ